jgi:RNA polymerase sigma-70 factor (ECF subfamily)
VNLKGYEICWDRELPHAAEQSSRLEETVSKLFELLKDPICRYLTLTLRARGEAEDLTQEVFLRLYTALACGQPIKNVRAWVFRVARNLATDLQRKKDLVACVDPESFSVLCVQFPDPSPDAEQMVLEREKRRHFEESLSCLSRQEQQCIFLRLEGLSYLEIAEVLGISRTTVPTYLSRGMKKLARVPLA